MSGAIGRASSARALPSEGRSSGRRDSEDDLAARVLGLRDFGPAISPFNAFLIQTGPREFCIVGQWESMEALAAARPTVIGMLDRFRHMLEDLGEGDESTT